MQDSIEVSFSWKTSYRDIGMAIIAVSRAIEAGHKNRKTLLAVLPQFSINSITLALDALFTAEMLENNIGVLTIHQDMNIIFELLKGKYILPIKYSDVIQNEDKKWLKPEVGRVMLYKFGCKNPSGAELLIQCKIKDNNNE